MVTDRGLAGLAFSDLGDEAACLEDMTCRWPNAEYVEDRQATAPYSERIFDPGKWSADQPLRVVLIGTDFQVRVWESLLKIPFGKAVTYSDIANDIGQPTAMRAVGAAVGANPISFVVPCHRALGKKRGADGVSLGPHPQAGDAWLGSRSGLRFSFSPLGEDAGFTVSANSSSALGGALVGDQRIAADAPYRGANGDGAVRAARGEHDVPCVLQRIQIDRHDAAVDRVVDGVAVPVEKVEHRVADAAGIDQLPAVRPSKSSLPTARSNAGRCRRN